MMFWHFCFCLFVVFKTLLCSDAISNSDCVNVPPSVDTNFVSDVLSHLDGLEGSDRTRTFNLDLCSGKKINDVFAAVMQKPKDKAQKETMIGRLKEVGLAKEPNEAFLVYTGGAAYESTECKGVNRSANIHISCDRSQEAKVSFVGDIKVNPGSNSTPTCIQVFKIQTKYMCEDFKASSSSGGGGMSFFGIFFILLLIIIVLYFSIGVLYKRISQDAQGWEQLPNSEFWIGMGERFISALDRLRYGDRYSPERYYNNIETTTPAFDQDQEEGEDRDDRLLTM